MPQHMPDAGRPGLGGGRGEADRRAGPAPGERASGLRVTDRPGEDRERV